MTRSELRLSDLKSREHVSARLLNIKIPSTVDEQITAIAEQLGASKTEVVIALLNEGLAQHAARHVKAARTRRTTVRRAGEATTPEVEEAHAH